MEERYLVREVGGERYVTLMGTGWVFTDRTHARVFMRDHAYITAGKDPHLRVVRIVPSNPTIAKLRAEVEKLKSIVEDERQGRDYNLGLVKKLTEKCEEYRTDAVNAEHKLDAMTAERDALAAQLARAQEGE
jgi:hypothetical protein